MRLRFWLSTLVILSWLLGACAGGATPAAPTGGGETAGSEAPSSGTEKITLRFWSHQNPAFIAANETLIQLFEEAHPDVDIVYEQFPYDVFIQTLQTSMPAGTEADVIEMFGTWVCTYANGGRLAQLPEDIVAAAELRDLMYEAPLGGYTCNGNLYGLPNEFNLEVGGALVNPKLFEEAGLPYPPQWQTMDDLIADAVALTKVENGQMTQAGFHFVTGDGIPFLLFEGILEQGGQYINGPETPGDYFNLDSPEALDTVRWMVNVVQDRGVIDPVLFNGESNWVGDAFFNGQVAIGFVGSWAAAEGLINYPDMEFDYVRVPPLFGDTYHFAADSGWGKVVSVNTQHPDLAWEFARFMTLERDNAETWNKMTGTIPALKAPVEERTILDKVPWIEAVLPILGGGEFLGPVLDRDQLFGDIIYPHVLSALQGVETAEEAVQAIDDEADEMAEQILSTQQ
ncbi:extracellular solute-binding protein [Litorilinea aerophila]|uniref:Extracellular solute-binding protein n=1 Tax=Litorilinea aerophila TaxID=1204385 RepID=A0A540VGM3_9CHLR|nr:extracellular solute-binding protein [Litorilinea aerophila]MCC9076300.1 extracellular solute-binding protein [Litorilinea aerophila]GIV77995.1 MAG: hypothetical protein KatS3mg050_2389 [Litorilinea sp.]GIV78001.1 MAG: hypothetical protein KatS3mg050_2395 [Litorilinea sp.]